MKRIIALTIALIMVLSLTACGEKTEGETSSTSAPAASLDIHKVKDEILKIVANDDPMEITTDRLFDLYQIDTNWVKDSACVATLAGVFPGDIIMIEAKDEASKAEIKKVLEAKLQDLQEQAKNYDKENYELAKTCKICERGNFIALFISSNHVQMEELFLK